MPGDSVDPSKAATHQQQAEPPTPEGGDVEEEYVVERILEQREDHANKNHYLIKWQGYPDEDNTWEPEENLLDCQSFKLLQAFKARYNETRQAEPEPEPNPVAAFLEQGMPPPTTTSSEAARLQNGGDGANKSLKVGFERGLQPQRILNAMYYGGELTFLLKWKGSSICEMVPAREANIKCPQIVIQFYEARLKWNKKRTTEELLRPIKDETDEEQEKNETNEME